jgi:capsular polysaccharide biosynthesis protein
MFRWPELCRRLLATVFSIAHSNSVVIIAFVENIRRKKGDHVGNAVSLQTSISTTSHLIPECFRIGDCQQKLQKKAMKPRTKSNVLLALQVGLLSINFLALSAFLLDHFSYNFIRLIQFDPNFVATKERNREWRMILGDRPTR